MSDLISRSALLRAIENLNTPQARLKSPHDLVIQIFDALKAAPAIEPRVAIGVNGGAVQWAMANHDSVDVMVVDFDIEGTGGFEFNLIRDSDGDRDPAYVWRETPSVDPDYFEMLGNSPSCNENGELESAEPNTGAWHIITDVMQCGVHEGYYGGSEEEALAEHERELRFLYGEYKTGPAGRIVNHA